MTLPSPLAHAVEEALEELTGRATSIASAEPVGGGCINPSARLRTDAGEDFFLKWNSSSPLEMFDAEADGLRALAASGAVRVPAVVATEEAGTGGKPAWLLLEFVPRGRPGPGYGRRLGESLRALHGWAEAFPRGASAGTGHTRAPVAFGWHRDNFIGSLPQANHPSGEWTDFWRDRRLEPQLRMARDRGYFVGPSGRALDELLDRIDSVMAGSAPEGPSLIHGDLWSGNYYPGPNGEPVLIDPAVYRGTGEVDLAMMELFGSLPSGFEEGYGGREGLAPAYGAFRRDLYQLYYLLVHVNLFGGSYVSGALRAAQRVLEET